MLTLCRAALLISAATGALFVQLPDPPIPTHEVEITITEGAGFASASPDRKWIAFDLLGSIWLMPFNGGPARKITPDPLEASHPTWSPDGTKIAFSAFTDDGGWHLASIGADGTGLTQLTDGPFEDVEPAWSDDGARMLFASDRGGDAHTLWELNVGSRATRRVVGGVVSHFAWASHGDIAFLRSNPTLKQREGRVVHAGGGEELVSTAPIPGAEPYPVWNPYTETLYWGPQRQWLSDVEALEIRRGQIVLVTMGRGSRLVTIGFTAAVKLKRADYGARHRVLEPAAPQPLRGILSPVVSRDGTRIAFAALGDVWVQPIRGLPVRITDDQFLDLDPAWSADGTRLAFSSDRSGEMQLWVHEFRGDADVQLTGLNHRIPQDGALGAAWSPDGARIAYRREQSWSMLTLPGTTPACRASTAGTSLAVIRGGRPSWGRDSCALALGALLPYAALSGGGVNQLVIEDLIGAPRVEVLFPDHSIGDRRGSSPVWSPDGFRFAFVADGRLWSVPVDPTAKPLAAPSMLADDLPESPSWQGDSEHVVYLTPTGLRRTTGIAPESIGADVMWAPEVPPDRVIVHAGRFFDGRLESVRLDVDITIDRGIVTSIDPHSDDAHLGTVIDAGDRFVMPGFVDPRVSLDPAFGEALGRILLAYGITTVRDVSLNTYAGVEQQESLANGRRIGPRVLITGDPFDGRRVRAPGGISIASRDALDAALRRSTLLGVDALHARERLGGPLEQRLVDEAHVRGLRASTESLFSAMTFGFDELALPVTGGNRNAIDIISRSGLFWTAPLAHAGFLSSAQRDPSILRDPRLALFPRSDREHYQQIAENISRMPAGDDSEEQTMKPFREGVAAVFKAGGRVVAASEGGVANQPYGLALHVELEQLALSGLTPFQAIQAATMTAADALGAADAIGSIEVGKLGDLVFLGGDPLQDITKTRDVRAVMRGGRYYDLAALGVQQPPR